MPPKVKISREMIVSAAFEIARTEGIDSVTARTVAQKLGCSTQPVMYCFATIEELKTAVYDAADSRHNEYLMSFTSEEDIMLQIGLNYIRFAIDEPYLFRLLFQSGMAKENNLLEMVNSEELAPMLEAMQETMKISTEQTKSVFLTLAMFAHGYASIIANNGLEFDEKTVAEHLTRAYNGAILSVMEE